ncbi:unannotated protein [freshwater metagenome]|uniref:Unannotated protein n=1 Tax=freshwater metagenome TaxID=449393 RepID=A0A6J7F0M1_9ZZZZ|nr:hypothetical protein [Actinomycetota bacterium]
MSAGDQLMPEGSQSGFLIILAAQTAPAEAIASAVDVLPPNWPVVTRELAWGTALLAGPAFNIDGDHVVLGTAVADPWGIPGSTVERAEMMTRCKRYGAQAVNLAAGPFAVADLHTGSITRAPNGVVPLYVAVGKRHVVGTHREIVLRLADSAATRLVPAGVEIHIDGTERNVADLTVQESIRYVDIVDLGREIEMHLARCTVPLVPFNDSALPAPHGFRLLRHDNALVASAIAEQMPETLGSVAAIEATRRAMSALWWQAGRAGMQLFVPALERPAMDTLFLALGCIRSRRR